MPGGHTPPVPPAPPAPATPPAPPAPKPGAQNPAPAQAAPTPGTVNLFPLDPYGPGTPYIPMSFPPSTRYPVIAIVPTPGDEYGTVGRWSPSPGGRTAGRIPSRDPYDPVIMIGVGAYIAVPSVPPPPPVTPPPPPGNR
ncbi:MAG TPA: hypothetical protein VHB48_10315 [Chitinophagaceae bacterium]|nr:hypothetical protein [Chitinophagaceae bacterium]